VLSCVGSGLATGWSLVQGVLQIVYKCKITEPHKEGAKARYGLQHHIRRRIKKPIYKVQKIKFRSLYPLSFETMNIMFHDSSMRLLKTYVTVNGRCSPLEYKFVTLYSYNIGFVD
jgi:hypothetical protein